MTAVPVDPAALPAVDRDLAALPAVTAAPGVQQPSLLVCQQSEWYVNELWGKLYRYNIMS